jgi:hypothetical protein
VAFAVFSFLASGQSDLTLNEIFMKNVQASGGRERLSQVQNVSFKTGGTRTYASAKGELKLVSGKDPVITEVVLVKGGKVRRNSFNATTEITGPQKVVYQTIAQLYAGLFSLSKFDGRLKLEGLKAYGPEKLYHLLINSDGVEIGFFLRTEDFFLKRLVFKSLTPDGDKYEVNYDFGPFEETEGLRIPLSWFSSQVGTRGALAEVTEFKMNQPLPEDFFDRLEVNVGTTDASAGELKGNVLDINASPFGLTITTNWMKADVEKAGLRTGDKLTLLVEGAEKELVFYASPDEIPPQEELAKDVGLLTQMPRGGDNYIIQFYGVDSAQIASKLKPLTAVQITKK